MSDIAIKIEGLSKKYVLSHKKSQQLGQYISLRDVLADKSRRLIARIRDPKQFKTQSNNSGNEDFWALKDVSFSIRQGDRVGIIGSNGAGKSTLLKILSRITEPTEGRVSIKGRVASLLEVGTGFHPELTGRENIYLNGAILGMSQAEIKKNFDAIVDFANVEKFLDTPVKRYSSGMYVRLAFAVAAHLNTEILLIDEVLAVGDSEFQKKCMGKMDEVSHKAGRTILFVSHNMSMVASLCEKAVLLNNGKIQDIGPVSSITAQYLGMGRSGAGAYLEFAQGEYGDDVAELMSVSIADEDGNSNNEFAITEPVYISMKYKIKKAGNMLNPIFFIYDSRGELLCAPLDTAVNFDDYKKETGIYQTTCIIPANLLNDGSYAVSYFMFCPVVSPAFSLIHFRAEKILSFSVVDNLDNIPTRGIYKGPYGGIIRPLLHWKNEKLS